MKKLAIFAVVAGVLVVFGYRIGHSYVLKDECRTRVKSVLVGLSTNNVSTEYQTGICEWYEGSVVMDQRSVEIAMDKFEPWYRDKGITMPIKKFEIEDIALQSSHGVASAIVKVTIDGKPFKMLVVKGEPIKWAD